MDSAPMIPVGFDLELPGRGSTYVTDMPGPTPDAPTILLLHAYACTGMLCWFPSIPALAQHFRVVTYDQRWHGRGFTEGSFTLADCAHDAAALVHELGLERVVVAGYSMGSMVAQRVWRQHPGVVSGLVLAATADRMAVTRSERAFHATAWSSTALASGLTRARISRTSGRLPGREFDLDHLLPWAIGQLRSISPWALGPAVAAVGRHHSTPWLPAVDVPTAVVVTARDRVISRHRQEGVAALIPGATVHVVDGGHASVVLEASAFVPVFVEACLSVANRMGRAVG